MKNSFFIPDGTSDGTTYQTTHPSANTTKQWEFQPIDKETDLTRTPDIDGHSTVRQRGQPSYEGDNH